MTMAVASGFALLALLGGFSIKMLSSKLPYSGISSSSKSDLISKDLAEGFTPDAVLADSDITSYPYSYEYPNYTGATYLYDDWFLMANGRYFNRLSHQWSDIPPEKEDKDKLLVSGGSAALSGASKLLFKSSKLLLIAGIALAGYVLKKSIDKKGK